MTTTDLLKEYDQLLKREELVKKEIFTAARISKLASKALRSKAYVGRIEARDDGSLVFPAPEHLDKDSLLPTDLVHMPSTFLSDVFGWLRELDAVRERRPQLEEELREAGLSSLVRQ